MAKAGLIPIAGGALFALAIGSASVEPARAQDTRAPDSPAQDTRAQDARPAQSRAPENCLPAPTGKPPAGNHWHYRTDPTTQTKCWYLRPAGDAAQKPATQPDTAAAAAPPAAPDQAGQETQQSRAPQAARATAGGKPPTRRQAADRSAPWPDPPSQAPAPNVTWPEPAQAPTVAVPESASQPPRAAAPLPNDQQETATAAQLPNSGTGTDMASDRQATEPAATAASDTDDIPVGLLLALVAAMLISGILLRRIVKSIFAQRPKVAVARREPVLSAKARGRTTTPPLAPQTDLAPGWVERLDSDVQDALRKLLRTLERQAA